MEEGSAAVGSKRRVPPGPRAAPAPATQRRCDEYPALAREAERLTREALDHNAVLTADGPLTVVNTRRPSVRHRGN